MRRARVSEWKREAGCVYVWRGWDGLNTVIEKGRTSVLCMYVNGRKEGRNLHPEMRENEENIDTPSGYRKTCSLFALPFVPILSCAASARLPHRLCVCVCALRCCRSTRVRACDFVDLAARGDWDRLD